MEKKHSSGKVRGGNSIFYIRGSVHCNSRLKKSNEMQQYVDIYLLLNYTPRLKKLAPQTV